MSINLQTVQDALIALTAVVGVALVFALGILAASGLVQRDKARNRKAASVTPSFAHQPTQTDRVPELISR